MTTPEQIDLWLTVPKETQRLEFKEAKQSYDTEKLYKYCVAIANEGGGHLLLGVTDKRPREVVGSAAYPDLVALASKLFTALGFRVDTEEVTHSDGRVIVFSIPSRTPGTAYSYKGTYFMRIGEELQPMTEEQLRKIFAEGKPDFIDEIAFKEASEEDVVRLLETTAYYELKEKAYPSSRAEVIATFLRKKFIISRAGLYDITNMGALILAKNLEEFESLSRKAVRVISYDGRTKAKVKGGKDITGAKGYACGFAGLVDYVFGQLPASEEIASALRTTTFAYPKKAVREILANAIVHQDLSERGIGITVEIFEDRIEVTNPGRPILDPDRFIDENQSRNERFAVALRSLNICEERGHGMDEVVSHIEVYQLPPYFCRLGSRHTTVILSRYKELKNLTPDERNQAVYQHCCLRYVNNEITNNVSGQQNLSIQSGHRCHRMQTYGIYV